MALSLYDNVRHLLGIAQERPPRRNLGRGYQFSVKDMEILKEVSISFAMIVAFFVFRYYIQGSAGVRLWASSFLSSRPQLQEVQLKKDSQGCWVSVLSITDDKTGRNKEIPVLFQVCSESSLMATELQVCA